VDARRHPSGCCFRLQAALFCGQHFTYDLRDLGAITPTRAVDDHFDGVPGRIHRVDYARMVTDTGHEIRRLLDYCGLEFEESCLRFYANPRAVRTASSQQVRSPIYRDAVDQWRHYESWLDPLKETLGPVLAAADE
jgi:hypothetical protein